MYNYYVFYLTISWLIIRVIAPKDYFNGDCSVWFGMDPDLYKYEVRNVIDDTAHVWIIGSERITRIKGCLTKEKIRLFLKQHITALQPMIVKDSSMEKFGIRHMKWNHIFSGPVPNFKSDTVIVNTLNKHKKKVIRDSDRDSERGSKSKCWLKGSNWKKSKSNWNSGKSKDWNSETQWTKEKRMWPSERQKQRDHLRLQNIEQRRMNKQKIAEKIKELKQHESQIEEWSESGVRVECEQRSPHVWTSVPSRNSAEPELWFRGTSDRHNWRNRNGTKANF